MAIEAKMALAIKVTATVFTHVQCPSSYPLPFLSGGRGSISIRQTRVNPDGSSSDRNLHVSRDVRETAYYFTSRPMRTLKFPFSLHFDMRSVNHLVVDLTTHPHAYTNSDFPLSFCAIPFCFDCLCFSGLSFVLSSVSILLRWGGGEE